MLEGFQSVALVDELLPGQSKVVMVNNREIALFNIEGTYFAIHNRCPHEGGPLCEGRVKGFVVACPWHDLAFDVRNGQGTAVDIVWGVMMCRWRERKFLSDLGENHSMMRRRRSGLPLK
jgi:nitrite reductase (NADH) small subunit